MLFIPYLETWIGGNKHSNGKDQANGSWTVKNLILGQENQGCGTARQMKKGSQGE